MTKILAAFAVSLALVSISAGATPAAAADMNGGMPGSMKDRGASGVPVPAPVPYQEHYSYYMGAGLGWTMHTSGDIGLSVGGDAVTGLSYPGFNTFNGPTVLSLTAGRYLTPSVRLELGLDIRTPHKRVTIHDYSTQMSGTELIGAVDTTGTNTYNVNRAEELKIASHSLMLNYIYDMNRGGRFNPYIGAGIGISLLNISRGASETATCASGVNAADPGNTACRDLTTPALITGTQSYVGGDSATGWGIAASLMAGLTYNVTDRTHLDVGYRLMYQGSKAAVSAPSLGSVSTNGLSVLTVGARVDHEIRTGLRFDLW